MNNKIRKIGLGLLSLAIISTSTAYAATPFKDLELSNYKTEILALQEKGIINGKLDGRFDPLGVLTMAEGIHIINATFGLNLDHVRFFKAPLATDYFVNADDNAWYADGLIVASVNGVELKNDIIPNAKFTKEAFVAALVGYMEVKYDLPMIKIGVADIADDVEINAEYSGILQRAIYYGIIELDDDKMLHPKAELSREEAVVIVSKLIAYMETNHITR